MILSTTQIIDTMLARLRANKVRMPRVVVMWFVRSVMDRLAALSPEAMLMTIGRHRAVSSYQDDERPLPVKIRELFEPFKKNENHMKMSTRRRVQKLFTDQERVVVRRLLDRLEHVDESDLEAVWLRSALLKAMKAFTP